MRSRFLGEDERSDDADGVDQYWNSPLVSLEDATRSLYSINSDIDILVARAKAKCLYSPHGLTHDQSAAIYLYTMEEGERSVYQLVNDCLRSNDTLKAARWFLYLKLFATGLEKLPLYKGTIYRIVRGDVAKNYTKFITKYWWGFSSCSKTMSSVQQFAPQNGKRTTMFIIECTSGRNITDYSAYKREDEIILMSGIELSPIDDSLVLNGVRIIRLRESYSRSVASRPGSNRWNISNDSPIPIPRSNSMLAPIHSKPTKTPLPKLWPNKWAGKYLPIEP